MNRLLIAEFVRLCKSFVFKLGLFFSAGLGIFIVIMRWIDVKKHPKAYAQLGAEYFSADGLIFVGGIYVVFVVAVVIGIFIGTEYGDGTIRNKLVVGHKRKSIYASKLVVCGAASLIMHGSYIVASLAAGNLLLEGTTMEGKEILLFIAAGSAAMLAMTAILLLISMSIQSKAAGSVVCLLVTMVMLFASLTIWQRLQAPKYSDGYSYMNEITREIKTGEKVENPRYLTGVKRNVYEFLNNFLPISQLYQVVMGESGNVGTMMLYDCLIIFVTMGGGIMMFQKKDLK